MRLLGHAVKEALRFIQLWMRLLGNAVKEAIMFIRLWMRLLGHAVKEPIMFIQLWMRLLGNAVKEAIMFKQLWMRLLGHAVKEAIMYTAIGNKQLRIGKEPINLRDRYAVVQRWHHYWTHLGKCQSRFYFSGLKYPFPILLEAIVLLSTHTHIYGMS